MKRIIGLLVLFLWLKVEASAAWQDWMALLPDTNGLDQVQPISKTGGPFAMMNANGVGQTFIPQKSPLARMEFYIQGGSDNHPFKIRLWKWQNDYNTTVTQPPLFTDIVYVPGAGVFPTLFTFYPNIAVQPNQTYYVEFKTDNATNRFWGIAGASENFDPYPHGQVRVNGFFRVNMDLYFKTYTTPNASSILPSETFSDPSLSWSNVPTINQSATGQDYYDLIKTYSDVARPTYLPNNAAANIKVWSGYFALFEAFLYRVNGTESNALNAAQLFANVEDGDQQMGIKGVAGGMFNAYNAYNLIRNSPSLTATDHARIKKLLIDSARSYNITNILPGGSQNQSLDVCLNYKAATTLWNDMPEYSQWVAYADNIWNLFKAKWDFEEDSDHYRFLSLRYVLTLASLYNQEDLVWQNPKFKALVDRFFDEALSLGPAPPKGDVNGWSLNWCDPIWLFEKAAVKYGDSKYKWMAQRLFVYQRNHVKNHPLWGAYNQMQSLCFAYLDMDHQIVGLEPQQQERIMAQQIDDESHLYKVTKRKTVGQTFVVSNSSLIGFDFKLQGNTAQASGRVNLWKWAGNYLNTTSQPPLYEEKIQIQRDKHPIQYKWRPFLEVEQGAVYYIEFKSDKGKYSIIGSGEYPDRYGNGQLLMNGQVNGSLGGSDTWFRILTLTQNGSTYTKRFALIPLERDQWGNPFRRYDWTTNEVPDKLTLRSGHGWNDFSVGINLVYGVYGHGALQTAAILSIVDGGSVLYTGGSYGHREGKEQSMALITRKTGGQFRGMTLGTQMKHFSDRRRATVASVSWSDIGGWDMDQERRFIFVKDRFLWVRDRLYANSSVEAAFGSVWHANDLYPAHGDNWFTLYNREPVSTGNFGKLFYYNPERYLLLYMVPKSGRNPIQLMELKATLHLPLTLFTKNMKVPLIQANPYG